MKLVNTKYLLITLFINEIGINIYILFINIFNLIKNSLLNSLFVLLIKIYYLNFL